MRIDISTAVTGMADTLSQLHNLTGPRAAGAYAKALNDTGFQIRQAMQDEMQAQFDRPTNYILKSPRVKMAKPEALSVTIEPSYPGGKGIDPQKILQTQSFGGRRSDKRIESALRRVGVLPNGYQTSIPATPYPGSDDGSGNIRGAFATQLISYFQAFGEQGYRANMTDKRKKSLARGSKSQSGRRYFVSYGRMRGNQSSHLAPGIWAASGTHGVDVRPVLMFVRTGTYSVKLDMDKVAKRADAENYLERRLRFRIREAAGV